MKVSILCFIILLMSCNPSVKEPLSIDDIVAISIADKVNWNYERSYSFNWEIRFNDSIELWHTNQISLSEFEARFNNQKVDSLNIGVMKNRKLTRKKLTDIWSKRNLILKKDYELYCDTVQPVFVKYIEKKEIVDLSNALLDTSYTYEKFIREIEPTDSILEDLELLSTYYYPLVGLTITLNSGDSLMAYCDGSGLLTLPWHLKHFNKNSYNPEINKILYGILPEKMNLNRHRLITGFSKKN